MKNSVSDANEGKFREVLTPLQVVRNSNLGYKRTFVGQAGTAIGNDFGYQLISWNLNGEPEPKRGQVADSSDGISRSFGAPCMVRYV